MLQFRSSPTVSGARPGGWKGFLLAPEPCHRRSSGGPRRQLGVGEMLLLSSAGHVGFLKSSKSWCPKSWFISMENAIWLVFELTPLKNMSQLWWLFPIYGKKKCSKPPTSYSNIDDYFNLHRWAYGISSNMAHCDTVHGYQWSGLWISMVDGQCLIADIWTSIDTLW